MRIYPRNRQFTSSIAARLLRVVFGSYFVVALLVTVVQLWVEYDSTKGKLLSSVREVAEAFRPSLSMAVWRYDNNLLHESLFGMVNAESVVGAQILEVGGQQVAAFGNVLRGSGAVVQYDKQGKLASSDEVSSPSSFKEELYPYSFTLTRPDGNEEERKEVIGRGVIYSSRSIVISWVKAGFILIIINSIVKTAALWVLFFLFANRIVATPLKSLTRTMDRFDSKNVSLNAEPMLEELASRNDELGSLYHSYIKLQGAIIERIRNLQALNRASEIMTSRKEPIEVGRVVLEHLCVYFGFNGGSARLFQQHEDFIFSLNDHFATELEALLGALGRPDEIRTHFGEAPYRADERTILIFLWENDSLKGVLAFSKDDKSEFTEEMADFVASIARSAAISLSTIARVQMIKEYSLNLEALVKVRTAEVQEKARRIEVLLQNIKLGIFSISEDLTIAPEYSKFLEAILAQKNPSGIPVMRLLFADTELGPDRLGQIANFLTCSLGEPEMTFRVNEHVLPLEIVRRASTSEEQFLNLMWEPQLDGNQNVEKILVVIRDVTDIRRMELESLQQRRELEVITQILSIASSSFEDFVERTRQVLNEIVQNLQRQSLEDLQAGFEHLHTIKGHARLLGLTQISDRVHEAEREIISLLSQRESTKNDGLLTRLGALQDVLDHYWQMYHDRISRTASGTPERELIRRCLSVLNEIERQHIEVADPYLQTLTDLLYSHTARSIQDVVDEQMRGLAGIASKLALPIPHVRIEGATLKLRPASSRAVQSAFIHFIMNSFAHGFEPIDTRRARGKAREGLITIVVACRDGCLNIRYRDDGRGLNLLKIKKVGVESGLIDPGENSPEAIARLILSPSFSTASPDDDMAGRGVGLSAVVKLLASCQGKLELRLLMDEAVEGFTPFEWLMILPSTAVILVP